MQKRDGRSIPDAALEVLRERAVAMHEAGNAQLAIAAALGVHKNTVHRWLKGWRVAGRAALKAKKRGRRHGAQRLLDAGQAAEVQQLMTEHCPDQLDLPHALWGREAVRELADPVMIAALAMRKLQALRLLSTPGVVTTTDVVVTIVQDLDRALIQAPVMRLRLQADITDWDAELAALGVGDAESALEAAPARSDEHDPEADRFVQLRAVAGALAGVVADPAHHRGHRIVGRQQAPGRFVVAGLGVVEPALDVLARRAGVVAGRQAVHVLRADRPPGAGVVGEAGARVERDGEGLAHGARRPRGCSGARYGRRSPGCAR